LHISPYNRSIIARNEAISNKALKMIRGGAVYILTNKNHTTLYTGVTTDLKRGYMNHHRTKIIYRAGPYK